MAVRAILNSFRILCVYVLLSLSSIVLALQNVDDSLESEELQEVIKGALETDHDICPADLINREAELIDGASLHYSSYSYKGSVPGLPKQDGKDLFTYNELYNYVTSTPLVEVFKAVVPLFITVGWVTAAKSSYDFTKIGLSQIAGNEQIAATFKVGDSLARTIEHMDQYANRTSHPEAFGRIGSAAGVSLIDTFITAALLERHISYQALTGIETFSAFSKSVIITGNLTKALAAYLGKKIQQHGYSESASNGGADIITSGLTGAVVSIGVRTQVFNKKYSGEQGFTPEQTLNFSQRFSQYYIEYFPHALTVATAYKAHSGLINACLGLAEYTFPDRDQFTREQVCNGAVSSTFISVSWLLMDMVAPTSFTKVFIDNIDEAGGLGIGELFIRFGQHKHKHKLTADITGLSYSTAFSSIVMILNVIYKKSDRLANLNNGVLLNTLLYGTDMAISHSATSSIYAASMAVSVLNNMVERASGEKIEGQSDLDKAYYHVPHHTGCMLSHQTGTTTESYVMNRGCYEFSGRGISGNWFSLW